MKSNTTVILIVVAVVVILFLMWQQQQAKASSDAQMLMLMQNQNQQTEANVWSSMSDWSSIIGGIGGLFGGGNNDSGQVYGDSGARLINTSNYSNNPYITTQRRATDGFDNLRSFVEQGYGVELNY
jgi:hypothetical protein